jgi:hypothetical protein
MDKSFFEAIDFIAKANHTTKKKMTHDILNLGIAQYLWPRQSKRLSSGPQDRDVNPLG